MNWNRSKRDRYQIYICWQQCEIFIEIICEYFDMQTNYRKYSDIAPYSISYSIFVLWISEYNKITINRCGYKVWTKRKKNNRKLYISVTERSLFYFLCFSIELNNFLASPAFFVAIFSAVVKYFSYFIVNTKKSCEYKSNVCILYAKLTQERCSLLSHPVCVPVRLTVSIYFFAMAYDYMAFEEQDFVWHANVQCHAIIQQKSTTKDI